MRITAALGVLLLAGVPSRPALAFGPTGAEFQANTYTSCNQNNPVVAALDGGGFVVVWSSGSAAYMQDGSYAGIFGQRYDGSGNRDGTEFQINSYTTDWQTYPDVAARSGGGFVVVWQSYDQDGSYYGVFGRRFDASGGPLGGEFRANTHTADGQYFPAITQTSDGFVVVWEGCYQDGSREGVFGQRYDDAGTRRGTEFRVNTYTTARQRFLDVAAADDDSFVVVWMSQPEDGGIGQDGSDAGIFGQRYAANGAPTGTEFQINAYTTAIQAVPAVAYRNDGGFVVVWEGRQPASGFDQVTDEVRARKFDAAGDVEGSEFQINTYTPTFEEDVSISVAAGGRMLVVWESEGGAGATDFDGEGTFARRLSAAGDPEGTEFQVNTYTVDDQDDPVVAGLDDGGFVVAWESSYQDGDQLGIFGQLYTGEICGDATGDAVVTASDALIALRAAVGTGSCDLCVCDVNDSGATNATDALIVLRAAVGQPVQLVCSAC